MAFADAKRLTTAGAKTMLGAAIAKAEEFGIAATVAIVDAGGHILVLERMDGGRFHTVHSATTRRCARRPTNVRRPPRVRKVRNSTPCTPSDCRLPPGRNAGPPWKADFRSSLTASASAASASAVATGARTRKSLQAAVGAVGAR